MHNLRGQIQEIIYELVFCHISEYVSNMWPSKYIKYGYYLPIALFQVYQSLFVDTMIELLLD